MEKREFFTDWEQTERDLQKAILSIQSIHNDKQNYYHTVLVDYVHRCSMFRKTTRKRSEWRFNREKFDLDVAEATKKMEFQQSIITNKTNIAQQTISNLQNVNNQYQNKIQTTKNKVFNILNNLDDTKKANIMHTAIKNDNETVKNFALNSGIWLEYVTYLAIKENNQKVLNYCSEKVNYDSFISTNETLALSIIRNEDEQLITNLFSNTTDLSLTAYVAQQSGDNESLDKILAHDPEALQRKIKLLGLSVEEIKVIDQKSEHHFDKSQSKFLVKCK